MSGAKAAAAAALLLTAAATCDAATAVRSPIDVGREIYLHGVLGSGERLEGDRGPQGSRTVGQEAACVNCHQRSGYGSTEGLTHIPPIAGRYLLRSGGRAGARHDNLPYSESMRTNREPYDEVTLARAIREGLDSQMEALVYLMPRFALGESDMAALIEYLKSLPVGHAPGVTDSVLHFATVITPDADAVKREGMLDVMRHYFADRNVRQMVPSRRLQPSDRTMYADTMYMVHRQWELHEWQLSGAPNTWKAQLAERMAHQPVFAILSGMGGSNWRPVHEFCEENGVPCLFPNVEVPIESGDDFFNLYFSRGVLLEAALIAERILAAPGERRTVIEQVYRKGDSGEEAGIALARRLAAEGIRVHDHALPSTARHGDVAAAVRKVRDATLILWLRPDDLAALGSAPGAVGSVYASGLLGGLEHAPLPADWRALTEMAYPFDLPEKRRVRVDYPLGWFAARHIPIVSEQVQADTYLACGLLSEALSHMADNFNRAYLIERLQTMMERRIVTGYYPRLTLATHQRFASKGGYLARFAEPSGSRLVADSEWLTP